MSSSTTETDNSSQSSSSGGQAHDGHERTQAQEKNQSQNRDQNTPKTNGLAPPAASLAEPPGKSQLSLPLFLLSPPVPTHLPYLITSIDKPLPNHRTTGQLLKGATASDGRPKEPSLLIGLKPDIEADVQLSARVKGDVTVGLY
ncbi:hypothetical protein F4779DRAFT_641621 [Xylariaceae sp. FL0662B]|nr:hypothetical protein F4779DRAFT_641621 [Xylariaceae sp. FL0662B]